MKSLDDIVLVSEEDFSSTYVSSRHLDAAVSELAGYGITFPIKHASPFFPQLSRLAMLVYFKGTLLISSKKSEDGNFDYAPSYNVRLFVADKLDLGWVERKLAPYFSVSPSTNNVAIGPNKDSLLSRSLARILYCMGIPTPKEHDTAKRLPQFISDLVSFYPILDAQEKEFAYELLLGACEAFFNIKTTFPHDFYWEFFLPVRSGKATAALFRRNVLRLLNTVFPDVDFWKMGEPREKAGGSTSFYDSIIGLRSSEVEKLLENYGRILDLEEVLSRRPSVLDFYLRHKNGRVPSPEVSHIASQP